jgi:hypothetical protein
VGEQVSCWHSVLHFLKIELVSSKLLFVDFCFFIMAARAAGVLRWGEDERRLVRKYLQEGKIDFTRLDDVDYLRGI